MIATRDERPQLSAPRCRSASATDSSSGKPTFATENPIDGIDLASDPELELPKCRRRRQGRALNRRLPNTGNPNSPPDPPFSGQKVV